MVKINTELVDDGLNTVANVQSYAQSVLGSLNDVIAAGNNIDTALFTTQDIVDVNINATGKIYFIHYLLYSFIFCSFFSSSLYSINLYSFTYWFLPFSS